MLATRTRCCRWRSSTGIKAMRSKSKQLPLIKTDENYYEATHPVDSKAKHTIIWEIPATRLSYYYHYYAQASNSQMVLVRRRRRRRFHSHTAAAQYGGHNCSSPTPPLRQQEKWFGELGNSITDSVPSNQRVDKRRLDSLKKFVRYFHPSWMSHDWGAGVSCFWHYPQWCKCPT
jgi:hypothetical protein